MPQLTLHHCCIADVLIDPAPKERGQDKIVKLNVDEEDLFDMLDHINPKTLIKYLDMRGISHRDALNVTFNMCDKSVWWKEKANKRKIERIVKLAENINQTLSNE